MDLFFEIGVHGMSYNHLSAEERGQIEAYLREGISQAEIARRLDRHRSTISREIKRGAEQRKKKSLASFLIKQQVLVI